jgi:putative MFS transporter
MVFNFCQAFGFYGFANWVPTLLVEKGITVTKSLEYSFIVAFAYPIAPLLAASFADRLERKWIICGACMAIIGFGIAFSQFTAPALLILSGVMLTAANMTCPTPITPTRPKCFQPRSAPGRQGWFTR